ncbi:unnamed protein product [Nyctereutes procyonoides]|uniref:(raccoon dog) hypothetical protein n=1 Tax=Nyctereutes procyonoides TaxID=34880 RepID=A0A811YTD3_NYCPR|nr:unnamed protein product [Nyctereutes procyonoides]
MLEIWLDHYRDDFCQLPEFPSLMKLLQIPRTAHARLRHGTPQAPVDWELW